MELRECFLREWQMKKDLKHLAQVRLLNGDYLILKKIKKV
jgi:hypothetical protein